MTSERSLKTLRLAWNQLSKPGPGGKKRLFFADRNDVAYLYCTGFVDESKYSLLDWVDSFKESLQPDGSYLLTEEQWMNKVRFHYAGAIGRPFDCLSLREGDWTTEAMEDLIRHHIVPSVFFSEKEFRAIFDEVKPNYFAKGVYRINKSFKEDLKKLVEMYPSPAQIRALGVAEMRAHPSRTKGGSFSLGPTPSQVAAQRLSGLLSKTEGSK